MNLGISPFVYSDLRDPKRLRDLAAAFDRAVERSDASLFARFTSYRDAMNNGIAHGGLDDPQESALLIDISRVLGAFVAQLFGTDETPLRQRAARDGQVAKFKKEFVAKRVAKIQHIKSVDNDAALAIIKTITGGWDGDFEYALAIAANRLIDLEREFPRGAKSLSPSAEASEALAQLRQTLGQRTEGNSPEELARAAAALHALTDLLVDWTAARWKDGAFEGWTSFRLPRPLVFDKLVPTKPEIGRAHV